MEITKELKRDALLTLLGQGRRGDGRGKLDYRPAQLVRDPLQNAEGSALCILGQTQVIAGVKVDMATPFPDRPQEGVFSTGAEFTPLGSPYFEPGPPKPEAIELARVVDRGIRSSEAIDLKSLTVEGSDKVLAIYVDLWVADHDGNLFDCATMAAMAALQGTRMPKVEDKRLIRSERTRPLPLSTSVVSCTYARVGEHNLLDPSQDEELGMDGSLTIATTPDKVCAVQKAGWAAYTQKDILDLVDISFSKGAELRRQLSI